jgi:hypothetical protein
MFLCIPQVFYYAVKAVVHPTAALFDAMTQTLKPLCVNALRRIFMMCDVDKVGCSLHLRPCLRSAVLPPSAAIKGCPCSQRGPVLLVMHDLAPPIGSLQGKCSFTFRHQQVLLHWWQDDALDDAELNAFQVRCFNAPLQPEELMGVKKVVQDKMPQVGLGPALRACGPAHVSTCCILDLYM